MLLKSALEYLAESLNGLDAHRLKLNDNRTEYELRSAKTSLSTMQCQLWWTKVPSPVAHEFLWDYVDIELAEDLQDALKQLQQIAPLSSGAQSVNVVKSKNIEDVPLFDIHPLRFRNVHPLGKVMANAGQANGGFTQEVMNAAFGTLQQSQQTKTTRLRYKVANDDTRAMYGVAQLGAFYADFNSCGRNIFSFPGALTEMFRRTDVEDITLDSLQFPYRTVYLSFGPQQELEVSPGWVVDGAYVNYTESGKLVQFAMTSAPIDKALYMQWNEVSEPTFIQVIAESQMKTGIGEAAEFALSEKIAQLRQQMTGAGDPRIAELEGVVDRSPENEKNELGQLDKKFAAWKGALRLVINGLAYLSAYPDDIDARWPEETPQRLYQQTKVGTHKQKRKAISQLEALGFTEIKYCGRSVRDNLSRESSDGDHELPRKATWVRGHWVRQPYGPGRGLRKLLWRRPVLRNAESALPQSSNEAGHIYSVR